MLKEKRTQTLSLFLGGRVGGWVGRVGGGIQSSTPMYVIDNMGTGTARKKKEIKYF